MPYIFVNKLLCYLASLLYISLITQQETQTRRQRENLEFSRRKLNSEWGNLLDTARKFMKKIHVLKQSLEQGNEGMKRVV